MKTICGLDCCEKCQQLAECGGCEKTGGHPFGGTCVAAQCIEKSGREGFATLKKTLMERFAALGIVVEELHLLNGGFVNLEYTLPNGQKVKLLEDNKVYLGNQIEIPGSDRCYGIVGDEHYLLVCQYGCNGSDPEIITYQKLQGKDASYG